MNALNGKVAVIGGASSGIGKAAALLFARQGAALVGWRPGARRLWPSWWRTFGARAAGHWRWRVTCAMKPSPNG
ncbi:hypothetical protein [Serratia marcescens]|uniref:hypothetical protein n=1 Tax=Serratia marcescens TaxID=615 RepID=UPI001F5B5CF0|nr:hypothetical protein [Serratia marcescens]